jgi:hypothetical protein
MSQDQPETPREQLAREAVEAYNELTAHAEELSPEAAQAVRSLRESLTSLVAFGTAADVQIAEMERTTEEFESIFYSGDVTVSARLLRRHMSAEHRAMARRGLVLWWARSGQDVRMCGAGPAGVGCGSWA